MLRRDSNTWTEAISKKLMIKRLLKRICEHTKRRLLQKGEKMGTVLGADPTKGT